MEQNQGTNASGQQNTVQESPSSTDIPDGWSVVPTTVPYSKEFDVIIDDDQVTPKHIGDWLVEKEFSKTFVLESNYDLQTEKCTTKITFGNVDDTKKLYDLMGLRYPEPKPGILQSSQRAACCGLNKVREWGVKAVVPSLVVIGGMWLGF